MKVSASEHGGNGLAGAKAGPKIIFRSKKWRWACIAAIAVLVAVSIWDVIEAICDDDTIGYYNEHPHVLWALLACCILALGLTAFLWFVLKVFRDK